MCGYRMANVVSLEFNIKTCALPVATIDEKPSIRSVKLQQIRSA